MGIGDGDLGRHVGHDVSIVDDAVSLRQTGGNVRCEIFVADAGLSEGVELVDMTEEGVDVKSSDGSQPRSKTVPSDEDFGAAEERGQYLDLSSDVSLHSCESIVEALMNLAA